jgi:hypothetical protein
MNCEQARALLPELAYGDAAQPEAVAHVRECGRCAAELRELEAVRRVLDAAPTPAARVDLPALYRDAAARERQRTRRWRRGALVAGAVAAGLLLLFALRLELRWHDRELVIGWGPPASVREKAPREEIIERPTVPGHVAMELQVLRDLIHAIAADVGQRDRAQREALTAQGEALTAQREALAAVRERVDRIAAASSRNWAAAQNDMRALYTAYFGTRSKGDTP